MEHLHVIIENLKNFVQQNGVTQLGMELCKVSSIDATEYYVTCVGQSSGKVYFDVPLTTQPAQNVSTLALPEVDSYVIVAQMDEGNWFVVATGQLTQLYHTAPIITNTISDSYVVTDNDKLDFQLSPSGMKLVVNSQSLKDAITDLQTALQNLTVNTPAGPSSIPINVTAINDAFTKILSTLQ